MECYYIPTKLVISIVVSNDNNDNNNNNNDDDEQQQQQQQGEDKSNNNNNNNVMDDVNDDDVTTIIQSLMTMMSEMLVDEYNRLLTRMIQDTSSNKMKIADLGLGLGLGLGVSGSGSGSSNFLDVVAVPASSSASSVVLSSIRSSIKTTVASAKTSATATAATTNGSSSGSSSDTTLNATTTTTTTTTAYGSNEKNATTAIVLPPIVTYGGGGGGGDGSSGGGFASGSNGGFDSGIGGKKDDNFVVVDAPIQNNVIAHVGTDRRFVGKTIARLLKQLRPEGGRVGVITTSTTTSSSSSSVMTMMQQQEELELYGFVHEITKDNDREDRGYWHYIDEFQSSSPPPTTTTHQHQQQQQEEQEQQEQEHMINNIEQGQEPERYLPLIERYVMEHNATAIVLLTSVPMHVKNWTDVVDLYRINPRTGEQVTFLSVVDDDNSLEYLYDVDVVVDGGSKNSSTVVVDEDTNNKNKGRRGVSNQLQYLHSRYGTCYIISVRVFVLYCIVLYCSKENSFQQATKRFRVYLLYIPYACCVSFFCFSFSTLFLSLILSLSLSLPLILLFARFTKIVDGLVVSQLPWDVGFTLVDVMVNAALDEREKRKEQEKAEGQIHNDRTESTEPASSSTTIAGNTVPRFYPSNIVAYYLIPLDLPPLEVDQNLLGPLKVVGLVCFGIVTLTVAICIWWTVYYRKTSLVVSAAQPLFLVCLAIGVLIMSATIVPLSWDDNGRQPQEISSTTAKAVCMSQPWLAFIGFSITFGILFSKTWRVNQLMRKSIQFKKTLNVKPKDVLGPFVVVLIMNLTILIAWTIVDPLAYKRQFSDGTDLWNRGTCIF